MIKNKKNIKIAILIISIITLISSAIFIIYNTLAVKPIKVVQNLDYSETLTDFLNPDQGFYRTVYVTTSPETITYSPSIIQEDFQLFHLRIDLSNFSKVVNNSKNLELSDTCLLGIKNILQKYFEAEKNVIVRFAYDTNFDGNINQEPTLDYILKHIKQLSSILNQYPLTITAIEAGMVGPWGEMHSSNLANSDAISKIIDAFLNNTTSIPILVRTPKMITDFLEKDISDIDSIPVDSSSQISRLGIFNDGFLGSETDLGTYRDREKETSWLSKKNQNLPFGGEVTRPQSNLHDIDKCIPEMDKLNLSYLNYEWNNEIVQEKWQTQKYSKNYNQHKTYDKQTAYKYIKDHMGYRFLLTNSLFKYTKDFKQLQIELFLQNLGFGNLNRNKDITVIFTQNETIKKTYNLDYFNGENSLSFKLDTSTLHGEFNIYISLHNTINNKIVYPIRFANNLWNEGLRANLIGHINIER